MEAGGRAAATRRVDASDAQRVSDAFTSLTHVGLTGDISSWEHSRKVAVWKGDVR